MALDVRLTENQNVRRVCPKVRTKADSATSNHINAYIAFRYVSNSLAGHGYVRNPPLFRPVEGCTSFLWVLLLDGVWRDFAIEPPVSANYLALLFAWMPTREYGLMLDAKDYPVHVGASIGYPGWVLPNVNIIDAVGLTDYVVARSPYYSEAKEMAHGKQPPPGYVEGFRPNVVFNERRRNRAARGEPVAADEWAAKIVPRETPLTAEEIIAWERRFAERVAR